ncbi:flavodoxin family protein [Kribbella catacumbae]|uniref:flavodoxin family protein n=1 Tax=Kribbella catacumbae TaxID=460086 RepID=UPI000477BC23|nr:NAD(P)H-dependent oxidoreductase [Kribbella catacumbae]
MAERFLFLLGSSRANGNTEALARSAAAGLAPDVEQTWLRLAELPLAPFRDLRHEGSGVYPEPVGNERELLDATLAATDLVIASPLYWYSVSTSVKLYLDYWSAWMRVPGVDFRERMRGKTMWAVTAHTADDVVDVDPLLGTLRLSAGYLGMSWGGELLGYGSRPGEVDSGEAQRLFAARAPLLAMD